MHVESLVRILQADFYAGVPDSQLKAICNYLINAYGTDPQHHVIAANEGNAVALAAGYHLASGKVPVVYMQNSGEGNIVNPVASLLSEKCYAIPMIFLIGWRGEPGVPDEPQHIYQGEITLSLLRELDIAYFVVNTDTTEEDAEEAMCLFRENLAKGKSVAFVFCKNALEYRNAPDYRNHYEMQREEIIRHIVEVAGEDPILSTTGKASRELFEIREARKEGHRYDFLTVGSMGHVSSIALGVALQLEKKKVWCIDGDGAALMHMGAMAVIGAKQPTNLVHILINNEAHETVGGQPTVAATTDFVAVAKACGYANAVCVWTYEALDEALQEASLQEELCFIEVKCAIGARSDLGRPTTSARQNKEGFMDFLEELRR